MPTLKDALTATLTAEAVEVSFLQAVAGIQMTENAYVCPSEDVSHSTLRFEMPGADAPDEQRRAETIAHRGTLHTRTVASEEWVSLDLPRPALGPLAFLTILYGADLEQDLPADGGAAIEVDVSASRAVATVPNELRSTLDDILSARGPAEGGHFPERCTARLSIEHDPLHIAEVTITTHHDGETATFALEIHPTSRRNVDLPTADTGEAA